MINQMDITTTIGCSVACSYCPQDKTVNNYSMNSKIKKMSLSTFKTCIDRIPLSVQINFSGYSEPFLNHLCIDMILYAHEQGHIISLYTTLVGLDIGGVDKLKHVPFESVNIHLPTLKGKENIKVDKEYEILLMSTLNLFINSTCVLMDWNNNESLLPNSLLDKLTIDKVPINSRSSNLDSSIFFTKERLGKLRCDRDLKSNVLLPNGDVTICCQDFGIKHIIGNLITDNYLDLFKSIEFNLIKTGLENNNPNILCRSCEYAISI
jgi:sulfatase maturation enzyme AslB (radical SAM superfamily)